MGLCGEIFGTSREIFTSVEYNEELTLKLEKLLLFFFSITACYLIFYKEKCGTLRLKFALRGTRINQLLIRVCFLAECICPCYTIFLKLWPRFFY